MVKLVRGAALGRGYGAASVWDYMCVTFGGREVRDGLRDARRLSGEGKDVTSLGDLVHFVQVHAWYVFTGRFIAGECTCTSS